MGLGESTDEYSVWYTERLFKYQDNTYTVIINYNNEIDIRIKGKYDNLKEKTVKDIKKIADGKKKALKGKLQKLSEVI